jgi:hypothetical protein
MSSKLNLIHPFPRYSQSLFAFRLRRGEMESSTPRIMPLLCRSYDQMLFKVQILSLCTRVVLADLQGETAVDDSPPLAPTMRFVINGMSYPIFKTQLDT